MDMGRVEDRVRWGRKKKTPKAKAILKKKN